MTGITSPSQVQRRLVVYVPGYDPVPPRRYRERYRREAARQAAVSGYQIALGLKPRDQQAFFGWHVSAEIDGASVETEVEVLVWSDIVKGSMDQSVLGTYRQLIRTAALYLGSGALVRLMRLRKGPVIAALYPVAVLLGQGLLALALAAAIIWIGSLIGAALPPVLMGFILGLSGLGGLGAAYALLDWCRRKDHLYAWYLMHDYAFSAQARGAYPPAQEARMAAFADRIARGLARDVDEVLVVGHSSGAYLAVSILADLLRANRVRPRGPALSLVTLGQVIPMVSFLPEAGRLRADLALLSVSDALTWVDVTAPGDGCAFALCDPVAVSGVAPPGKRWPLVISAAFTQTLSPQAWRALRWRFFERHFQYLNAFDQPGDYDFFAITAGPKSLGARFQDRAPSASRIERAVNRYTDQAA